MATRASDLRSLDDDVLIDRLGGSKQELFNLRFQFVTGRLENSAELTRVKRDIARINTVLREREIAAAEAMSVANTASSTTPSEES